MCVQAAHAEISALQGACDSLKTTLAHMHAAHAAAEREVASLKEDRVLRVHAESCNYAVERTSCSCCALALPLKPLQYLEWACT